MTAAPIPDDPGRPMGGEESISASAERARAELHAEIERVRRGVEQMLDEQEPPSTTTSAPSWRRCRRTCAANSTRPKRTSAATSKPASSKSQKRTDRRVGRLEDRTSTLEQRLDDLAAERRLAEYRIHSDTEQMLDGLLRRGAGDC